MLGTATLGPSVYVAVGSWCTVAVPGLVWGAAGLGRLQISVYAPCSPPPPPLPAAHRRSTLPHAPPTLLAHLLCSPTVSITAQRLCDHVRLEQLLALKLVYRTAHGDFSRLSLTAMLPVEGAPGVCPCWDFGEGRGQELLFPRALREQRPILQQGCSSLQFPAVGCNLQIQGGVGDPGGGTALVRVLQRNRANRRLDGWMDG